jgi:hypothetical protein
MTKYRVYYQYKDTKEIFFTIRAFTHKGAIKKAQKINRKDRDKTGAYILLKRIVRDKDGLLIYRANNW